MNDHDRQRDAASVITLFDRATLVGIGVGVALLLQPFWSDGFRLGFFVTFAATLAQVVTSHLSSKPDR